MDSFNIFLPFVGNEFNVLALVGIGFAVGVLAGFFGMGGGWVLTPALYSLGFPMQFAIGTGLAEITAHSALASVKHRRMGNVDYTLGLVVGAFMTVGVEGGKRVVNWLVARGIAGPVVGWLYVVFLLALGLYMIGDYAVGLRRSVPGSGSGGSGSRATSASGEAASKFAFLTIRPTVTLRSCDVQVSLWVLAGVGLAVGFLAGVLGCGGGFALVPAFVYLIGIPTVVAVGTSLLCVVISGAYGAFAYGAQGNVELIAVLWMLVGGTIGAQFGTSATRHVRGYGIRLLYAVMLLLAATGVVMKELAVMPDGAGDSRLAPVVILGGGLMMSFVIIGLMMASIVRGGRQGEAG